MKKERKERLKLAALLAAFFAGGILCEWQYREFIENNIPYSYRGNIIENVFYLCGKDTLDMLCSENPYEFIKAMIKKLTRK